MKSSAANAKFDLADVNLTGRKLIVEKRGEMGRLFSPPSREFANNAASGEMPKARNAKKYVN